MKRHSKELTNTGHTRKTPGSVKAFIPILYMLVLMFVFSQCKRAEHVEPVMLHGKWDIHRADRNGKETPYLRGGYMVINPDGTMTINITGEDERGKYVLDKEAIRMNDDKTFIIQSLTNDSLSVSFKASPQSDFIFYMNRHKDETQ